MIVRLVKRLAALPLLKIGDISAGFDYAKSTTSSVTDTLMLGKMNKLLEYAENTWASPNALFGADLWSRYDVS